MNCVECGHEIPVTAAYCPNCAAPLSVAAHFDRQHRLHPDSPTLRAIWRNVYGDDWPDDMDPSSFVTVTELRRIAQELHVRPDQTVVDLGCGRGGPTLWMAREIGASFVGIDISSVGVERAVQQAVARGLAGRVHFQVGDIMATGLPDAAFDGAMSVSALGFVNDKGAAAREVARILRPGARFVFTAAEEGVSSISLPGVLPVDDYRPFLQAAGFTVEVYEEVPDWKDRQLKVFAGVIAAKARLGEEIGATATESLLRWARTRPTELVHSRRVCVIAEHP